eukprot:152646_1
MNVKQALQHALNQLSLFNLKGDNAIQLAETVLILLTNDKPNIIDTTAYLETNNSDETNQTIYQYSTLILNDDVDQEVKHDSLDDIDMMVNTVDPNYHTFMKCDAVSKRIKGFHHNLLQLTDFQNNILNNLDRENKNDELSSIKGFNISWNKNNNNNDSNLLNQEILNCISSYNIKRNFNMDAILGLFWMSAFNSNDVLVHVPFIMYNYGKNVNEILFICINDHDDENIQYKVIDDLSIFNNNKILALTLNPMVHSKCIKNNNILKAIHQYLPSKPPFKHNTFLWSELFMNDCFYNIDINKASTADNWTIIKNYIQTADWKETDRNNEIKEITGMLFSLDKGDDDDDSNPCFDILICNMHDIFPKYNIRGMIPYIYNFFHNNP